MTTLPDDLVRPAETRLARRVRAWSDQAALPIDAAAIAAAVVAHAPRAAGRSGRGRSLRLGFSGRLLFVGVAVALLSAAGAFLFGAGTSPRPIPTASETSTVVGNCAAADLTARLLGWEGAAGSRTADLELISHAAAECWVPERPGLRLVDGAGTTLIEQKVAGNGEATRSVRLSPGQLLHTFIITNNYCGAPAVEPASVQIDLVEGTVTAGPTVQETSGVPPCNGASAESQIAMTFWERGPAIP